MVRVIWAAALVLACGVLMPTDARALFINFRALPFETSANFDTSYTQFVDGVGNVTLTAAEPAGATLYWDSEDGFGVRASYETDEVESYERLVLSFDDGPVQLNTLYLTDLFYENGYRETGSYSLDGGGWIYFEANQPSSSNGDKTLNVGGSPLVSAITFRAPGETNCTSSYKGTTCENHEYSLAGVNVDVASVPEPGTLILMGTGIMGLALWRRRRESRDS